MSTEPESIAALAELNLMIRELNKYKEKENKSVRLLKTKYDNLVLCKENLIKKHHKHCEKPDLTSIQKKLSTGLLIS